MLVRDLVLHVAEELPVVSGVGGARGFVALDRTDLVGRDAELVRDRRRVPRRGSR